MLIEPGTARVRFANRAAHRLGGGQLPLAPDPASYPDHYPCFDEAGRRLPFERMPGVRAARGERLDREPIDWETPDGRRSLLVSTDTIVAPDGSAFALLTFEDITELQAERRRATLLAEVGDALARPMDLPGRLHALAPLLVPRLADWCVVVLRRPGGRLQRAVAEHADPVRKGRLAELEARWPLNPSAPAGTPRVLRTGRPELHRDAERLLQAMTGDDAEHQAVLRELGFGSAVVVPLRARGELTGALGLFHAARNRYDEDDLTTVHAIADHYAVMLENVRIAAEREAMLENVADAVTAQSPDGRLVFANQAAVRLLGYDSREALLSAPPEDIVARFGPSHEDGRPVAVEELPGRRALRGEEPEPLVVRWRRPATGEPAWARVKARPVRSGGEVLLAINVIEDITEIKEAEQGQRYLAEASRVLASSLDYEETLRSIAALAVPEIADWCAVDLRGESGIEHVAAAHVDPAKVAFALELRARYPPDPSARSGVPEVLRTGRSVLYPEIPQELLEARARDPEHLELMRSLGMRSAMIVPMTLRDRVLGAITFVSAETGRRFDAQDLALAEELGRRAAVAVDNARLYRTRSTIAKTLQASLLPPLLPEVPGLELAAAYRAAGEGYDVGGDFYDVFSMDEDHWFVVIGDVCGKGAAAAAVTALARYTIRAAAARRRSPAAILRWLNDVMLSQADAGRFATLVCVHLDLSRETIRASVAVGGHPLPLVLRADGRVCPLGAPGMLLGLVEPLEVQERTVELRPGDAAVLYTDGLTEAGAPERVWSPEELEAALRAASGRTAPGIIEHLLAAALPDRAAPPRDDIAVLALRVVDAAGPEPAASA